MNRLFKTFIAALALTIFNITPVSAQGMGREQNIAISCVRLAGMRIVLDRVVNEQQLYNNSTDIFKGQGDCTLVPGRSFTADRWIAAQNGVWGADTLGGFIGWIVTDKWLIPVEHIAYLDRAKEKSYRPADILSRKRFTLRSACFRHTQTLHGVQIYGHQFDDPGRRLCGRPILISN